MFKIDLAKYNHQFVIRVKRGYINKQQALYVDKQTERILQSRHVYY